MKQSYINDIDIIIEAIENKDLKDAVQMLQDLKEDLKIILLMCWFCWVYPWLVGVRQPTQKEFQPIKKLQKPHIIDFLSNIAI